MDTATTVRSMDMHANEAISVQTRHSHDHEQIAELLEELQDWR